MFLLYLKQFRSDIDYAIEQQRNKMKWWNGEIHIIQIFTKLTHQKKQNPTVIRIHSEIYWTKEEFDAQVSLSGLTEPLSSEQLNRSQWIF